MKKYLILHTLGFNIFLLYFLMPYFSHTSPQPNRASYSQALSSPNLPHPSPSTRGNELDGRRCAGSHLGEAVLGEHVKKGSLPTLAVSDHHYLTLHTLAGIHAGFQG